MKRWNDIKHKERGMAACASYLTHGHGHGMARAAQSWQGRVGAGVEEDTMHPRAEWGELFVMMKANMVI
jgi:hypothetical protein